MTIRQFLSSYINFIKSIAIFEYIGDASSIGADLEEDYEEVGTYRDRRYIPENVMIRKVEYFNIENGKITIWMED
jgi:hypothetical protein